MVVDADQVIIEVARFRVEDSDKALIGVVGEDSRITPLLAIGTLVLMKEEGTPQAAAREFAASTVIKWVTSQRIVGPPSGNHFAVAVADKQDASKIEYLLSATHYLKANKKTAILPARLATRRTKSMRFPPVVTGPRRFIECASCAECLVRSMGLYTHNCS